MKKLIFGILVFGSVFANANMLECQSLEGETYYVKRSWLAVEYGQPGIFDRAVYPARDGVSTLAFGTYGNTVVYRENKEPLATFTDHYAQVLTDEIGERSAASLHAYNNDNEYIKASQMKDGSFVAKVKYKKRVSLFRRVSQNLSLNCNLMERLP